MCGYVAMAIMKDVSLIVSLICCFFMKGHFVLSVDRIFANQSLSGDQKIISTGGTFRLGFFQSGISSYNSMYNYYLGISYYKLDEVAENVVWVANRETPISDTKTAVLKLLDGNLVILNELKEQVWSTNIVIDSTNRSRNLVAVLLHDGNLVIIDESSMDTRSPVWQSFDHPAHAWLPGAKLSFNKHTNTKQVLTSWTSRDDPAPGPFSLELDPNGSRLIIKWDESLIYWTSGSWSDHMFSLGYEHNGFLNGFLNGRYVENKKESMNRVGYGHNDVFNLRYVDNENESYFVYSLDSTLAMSMFAMNPWGRFDQFIWMKEGKRWGWMGAQPRRQCEVYGICGPFSICNNENSEDFCECLDGFHTADPRNSDSHSELIRVGCWRHHPLQCGNRTSYNGRIDTFKKIPNIFLSEQSSNWTAVNIAECESSCLSNCFCTAYAYDNHHCSVWNAELLNLRQRLPGESRRAVYVRLAASDITYEDTIYEINNGRKRKRGIAIIGAVLGSVSIMVVFLGILSVGCSRRQKQITKRAIAAKDLLMAFLYRNLQIAKQRVSDKLRGVIFVPVFQRSLSYSRDFQAEFAEIPIFTFEMIQAATDEFSAENKLGEGGYGPVYKGKLPNGQDIAVKRLSRISGQGVEQFKNEVALISKVQHWNLVKLLGYCIQGEDRMLVYEYMPNKSLDAFIFESASTEKAVLDWGLRNSIIEGIARGLLYLHRDSRVKIIHRDLKASNILLDEHMIPRISDFGMARMVGIDQSIANTNRIVGTYGYMSPEYAMRGIISVKSDIFSFGVLLLEIVSGKRNTDFYDDENPRNLLGYAWQLWSEENVLELVDPNLANSCDTTQVYRCIHVALLCVQEHGNDRPTMSEVVFMLCNDTNLATPKKPGFCMTGTPAESTPLLTHVRHVGSNNDITISSVYGR